MDEQINARTIAICAFPPLVQIMPFSINDRNYPVYIYRPKPYLSRNSRLKILIEIYFLMHKIFAIIYIYWLTMLTFFYMNIERYFFVKTYTQSTMKRIARCLKKPLRAEV